jgi:WD40 repeat protein
VTQVEFVHDGATLVSGGGGTTRYWDVQSGETKQVEEAKSFSERSIFAFSKGSSREQKVGKFLITTEGDILRIFKSEGGLTDKADKDTAPVAFFRAPAPIVTVDTSGAHITVGCQNGEVLQLRAMVLWPG